MGLEYKTSKDVHNGGEKMKRNTAIIIAAVIGAIGAIIAALIMVYSVKTIKVNLINIETTQGISGEVFIDADKDGLPSYPENPAVLKIRRSNRVIRAESDGYEPTIVSVKDVVSTRNIEMKKIVAAGVPEPVPLSLVGSNPWDLSISRGDQDNEIIVNGNLADAGGFSKNGLATVLHNRTLVLYFSNVRESEFSLSRMVRLTYNISETTLNPINASTSNGGYIPAGETPLDRGIEYPIPNDFDGRLNFVFYQANLRNLKITAFYK
jgi:hypothetical protein